MALNGYVLRLLSLLLLAITRSRRTLDQISPPRQSQSATRPNTDPASTAASKWLKLVKLTACLNFIYPGSIPAWNSTGKTPYTKQAKYQRIVNVLNPKKLYCAVADSVGARLPDPKLRRCSASKIIYRVLAGSILRRGEPVCRQTGPTPRNNVFPCGYSSLGITKRTLRCFTMLASTNKLCCSIRTKGALVLTVKTSPVKRRVSVIVHVNTTTYDL